MTSYFRRHCGCKKYFLALFSSFHESLNCLIPAILKETFSLFLSFWHIVCYHLEVMLCALSSASLFILPNYCLFYFKNGFEYLRRGIVHMFILGCVSVTELGIIMLIIIIIITILLLVSFSHQLTLVGFQKNLSEKKFLKPPGNFWVFLLILTMPWAEWSCHLLWFSNPPLFSSFLLIAPNTQTKIAIITTLIFYGYFSSLARFKYLSVFFSLFEFHYVIFRNVKILFIMIIIIHTSFLKLWHYQITKVQNHI